MTADLAVVGGGIIGCFVAHQAARSHPERRVLLIERSAIGSGASGWSAGVSFPLAATPPHRRMVQVSAAAYARLRDTPAARFLRPVRMVYVVGAGETLLRDRVVDTALREVDSDERARVERMLPGVRIGSGERMLTHDGHGFVVDARGLAQWLAMDAGVTVHLGHHVTGIEPDGGGYRVVGDGTRWRAERVVVATGPWPALTPPTTPPVRTKRVSALHVDIPAAPGDPLVYFVDDDVFVLPTAEGSALVSYYRDVWDVGPAAMTGQASAADLRVGTAALRRRCPAAADAVTGGRTFCDAYAPDRLPVVTAHDDRLVSVRGGSGSGVRLAPALAASALRALDTPIPNGRTADTAPVAVSG